MGGFQGHEHANVAVFSGDLSHSPFPSFHVAREGLLSRSTYSGGSPKPTKQYLLDYVLESNSVSLFITHRYADIVIR